MLVDLKYLFLHKSFVFEIFHTFNQYIDGLMTKNLCEKKKISVLGKVSTLAIVKNISQLHRIVDFKYLFFGKSFGLEI